MTDSPERIELIDAVTALVRAKFGGDWPRAFGHYDGDNDGRIDRDELSGLLRDAGVGNYFSRGKWASGVIAELDADADGCISRAEFEGVFAAPNPGR